METNQKLKNRVWFWVVGLLLLVILGVGVMNGQVLWEKAKEKGMVSDRSDDDPHISMDFYQMDIRLIFNLLASQCGINIVLSPNVQGEIGIDIRNVHWKDALESIAQANGYKVIYKSVDLVCIVAKDEDISSVEYE